MELRHYMSLIWRWGWLIVLGTALAAAAAFAVSNVSTPVYRATSTLLVNQATATTLTADYTSVLASQQLAITDSELVKKRPILQEALDKLKLPLSADVLATRLDVSPVRNTTLIQVSLEDENPQLASALVNEIGIVFIKETNDLQRSRFASSEDNLSKELKQIQSDINGTEKNLDQNRAASSANPNEVAQLQSTLTQYQNNYAALLKSYEDLRITEARSIDSISVAEPAAVPDKPVRPQILLNTLLAALAGALLAVGIAFLVEYLDDTVKSPDDVREALGLVTMGVIARFEREPDGPNRAFPVVSRPRSPVSEAFRALRTNIQFASPDHKIRTILVTSCNPGEGKTTIAANLAAALAQAGQSVALVDADLRCPAIHRLLNLSNSGGLTNAALAEKGKLNGFLQGTSILGLKALPSGPLPPNPAEMLGFRPRRTDNRRLENTCGCRHLRLGPFVGGHRSGGPGQARGCRPAGPGDRRDAAGSRTAGS